ncbi:MAG: glycosyltransferase family 25 protein [Rhizobiaceae bacterium]
MPVPVYILTIDAPDGPRRANARRQLEAVGLEAEFVQGSGIGDPAIHTQYDSLQNLIWQKRSLSPGEIAVYCGHREIWRRLVDSGARFGLVLEDDFGISDAEGFRAILDDCERHPDGWDIVKLFDFNPKPVRLRRRLGSSELVAHRFPAAGAVGYLINREAATRMLARRRFFRAIDEDWSWPWEFDLRVWSLSPNCIEEISVDLGGSVRSPAASLPPPRNPIRAIWANVIQAWKALRSKGHVRDMSRRLDPPSKRA